MTIAIATGGGSGGGGGGSAAANAAAFNTAVPMSNPIGSYVANSMVTGPITFTQGAKVLGGFSQYRMVADAVNIPDITTNFKKSTGSGDYDNRAGIVNVIQFNWDGTDAWSFVYQDANAVPIDTTPPTEVSATVQNATPTVINIIFSEPMNTAAVPDASTITASGHTVTALAWANSTTLNATVSAAYVNGEAASSLAYTANGTNNLKDLAGLDCVNFSGKAITNNVGGAVLRYGALSGVTEGGASPNYTYAGTGSLYGGAFGGILNFARALGTDFIAQHKVTSIISGNEPGMGLTTSATPVGFAALPYFFYAALPSGNWEAFTSGTTKAVTNTLARAEGDNQRFRLVGTTLYAEISRAATPTTWLEVTNWTGVPNTAYKIQCTPSGTSGISVLSGTGLV